MSGLKIGLIEVSHWHAGMYVDALKELGEDVVAVSDENEIVAKKVAEKIGCHHYTNYHEMLEKEDIEFVFSFGKHVEMPKIIRTLVEKEIPFNSEKPCGVDYKTVEELAVKASKKNLFNSVSFVKRVSTKIRETMKTLDEIGETRYIYFKYITGPPGRYIKWGCPWMLDKNLAGGGCLINLGIHYIDLVNYLTKETPKVEHTLIHNKIYRLSVEDYALLILKTDRTYSIIEVAYTPCHKPEEYYSITGLKGRIIFSEGKLTKCLNHERETMETRENEYSKFIEETLDKFKRGKKPIANLEDAAKALKVVNKAYNFA